MERESPGFSRGERPALFVKLVSRRDAGAGMQTKLGSAKEWIAGFDLAPVLIVPADRVDFVKEAAQLESVIAAVQERLRGRQGELFA